MICFSQIFTLESVMNIVILGAASGAGVYAKLQSYIGIRDAILEQAGYSILRKR